VRTGAIRAARVVMAVGALLPAAAPTTARASGERVVVKHYVGAPTSAGVTFCGDPRFGADGIGRDCYLLDAGETQMAVSIVDSADFAVAGRIVFFGVETGVGEPPDELGSVAFCNSVEGVAIPPAATHLDIEVGDHVDRTGMPCGTVTTGVYGTITARFQS